MAGTCSQRFAQQRRSTAIPRNLLFFKRLRGHHRLTNAFHMEIMGFDQCLVLDGTVCTGSVCPALDDPAVQRASSGCCVAARGLAAGDPK